MLAAARLLLAAGADPNAGSITDSTAMHLAAAYCNAALVRLLAAWGADPLHANKPGNRPLQHLVANVELDSDDEDEGLMLNKRIVALLTTRHT